MKIPPPPIKNENIFLNWFTDVLDKKNSEKKSIKIEIHLWTDFLLFWMKMNPIKNEKKFIIWFPNVLEKRAFIHIHFSFVEIVISPSKSGG